MTVLMTVRTSLIRATLIAAAVAFSTILPTVGRAQTAPPASNPASAANAMAVNNPPPVSNLSLFSPVVEYFADWFPRVTRIQSEQPHWITPLVTVTPRLEEEYRYDQLWQAQPHGKALDNFGANKGLEL